MKPLGRARAEELYGEMMYAGTMAGLREIVVRQRTLPNGVWPGPANIDEVVLRAMAMCHIDPIDKSEFSRFVQRAAEYVRLDELKTDVQPGRVVRGLDQKSVKPPKEKSQRLDQKTLEQVASRFASAEEAFVAQETLEYLKAIVPKMPEDLRAPMNWLIANYDGSSAPDWQALGVARRTWQRLVANAQRHAARALESRKMQTAK